jgi:SNF2 family DNA or RNA helicase
MPNLLDDPNEKEQRVLSKLQAAPGLVLAHGVGTGKTRTAIQTSQQLQKPTDVIVPAALQDNYKKELHKWLGRQPSNVNIRSQQAVARNPQNEHTGLMVVDEAHRLREPNSKLLKSLQQIRADKKLLLTATPVYNHPSDISALVNLAANKQVLPENKADFNKKFISEKPVNPGLVASLFGVSPGSEETIKHSPELIRALKQYVDYEPGNSVAAQAQGFPSSREEVVKVPLHQQQQDIYKTIMGKAPLWTRWKVKAGLPPNRGELKALQAFLTGARQVSNSDYDFIRNKKNAISPKIDSAASYLKNEIKNNPRYKGVVYSNYLSSGLAPYKANLDKAKIPYGEFSGSMPKAVRDQMVKDYNEDKLKALLISSAGAEGLDLKGTRLLQILEPHFNREKEKQIIGRAARYMSHAALPADEQNVLIQRYLAQPRGNFLDKMMGKPVVRGTDEYISDIADRKEKLNQQMMQLVAKHSR